MDGGAVFRRVAAIGNKAMLPALRTSIGRRLFGGSFAVLTYRGRRSGREFSLPVGYRRSGDTITIGVMAPDSKNWWRNFLDDGAPVRLQLGPRDYDVHAVATRSAEGAVVVSAELG